MYMTYYVTCSHKIEAYRFKDTEVIVKDYPTGTDEKLYYAQHSKLGCSKNYKTPKTAISMLFHDNACFNVLITEPTPSPTKTNPVTITQGLR